MKSIYKTFGGLGILVFMLASAHLNAASYQGKVTHIFAYGKKVFVRVSQGGWDASDSCTNNSSAFELWLDPSDEYGKALLSIALIAKTTDRLVWVAGSGNCIAGPRGKAEGFNAIDLKG